MVNNEPIYLTIIASTYKAIYYPNFMKKAVLFPFYGWREAQRGNLPPPDSTEPGFHLRHSDFTVSTLKHIISMPGCHLIPPVDP